MSNQLTFNQAKEKYFKTLILYVPVVSKVHGNSHPEFYQVHALFDAIHEKMKNTGLKKPELNEEFAKLREITSDYTVPEDVCESYEAVYNMLAELDQAYNI